MAHRKIEQEIEQLEHVRDLPRPEACAVLRKALRDRVNLVCAKAAKLASALGLRELVPDLLRAFEHHLDNGMKTDPKCWAKIALANALAALESGEAEPFLRGMRYVQMEPTWGGPDGGKGVEDVAPPLRGACLLGLIPCPALSRDELLKHVVDSLTDEAYPVRIDAVRALEQIDGESPVLLLRLKARLGDPETPVIGQVFDTLLRLEGNRAVPFIAYFLSSAPIEVAEEAALALGTSRLSAAIAALREAWEKDERPELRPAVCRALSASRQPEAIDLLIDVVKTGPSGLTDNALEALALHRDSIEIRAAVEQAAGAAGQQARRLFDKWFS